MRMRFCVITANKLLSSSKNKWYPIIIWCVILFVGFQFGKKIIRLSFDAYAFSIHKQYPTETTMVWREKFCLHAIRALLGASCIQGFSESLDKNTSSQSFEVHTGTPAAFETATRYLSGVLCSGTLPELIPTVLTL